MELFQVDNVHLLHLDRELVFLGRSSWGSWGTSCGASFGTSFGSSFGCASSRTSRFSELDLTLESAIKLELLGGVGVALAVKDNFGICELGKLLNELPHLGMKSKRGQV